MEYLKQLSRSEFDVMQIAWEKEPPMWQLLSLW